MALTECFRYRYFTTVTITVNGFDLFQLMVISVTVTVNLNHTGDWHTVVVEIPWSSVPTTTMDCHSKLVGLLPV